MQAEIKGNSRFNRPPQVTERPLESSTRGHYIRSKIYVVTTNDIINRLRAIKTRWKPRGLTDVSNI